MAGRGTDSSRSHEKAELVAQHILSESKKIRRLRRIFFCIHGQKENSAVFRYSGGEGAQRRDVVKLDDMLGHNSVKTTRIYLISAGMEHAKVLS